MANGDNCKLPQLPPFATDPATVPRTFCVKATPIATLGTFGSYFCCFLVLTLGSTIFVCILLGIARVNSHERSGYPLILIGTIVLVSSLVQLLFTRPRVVIDDEGIAAVVFGGRKFLWKEIKRAELKYMHRSGDKITLILHDNSHHAFTLFGVNVSADEVYFEIQQRIRKYGRHADEPAEVGVDDDDAELS